MVAIPRFDARVALLGGRCIVSYRQLPIRAVTALVATAGALAPVVESLARRRRKRRPDDDDDDDDKDLTLAILRRRRRRRQDDDEDDDDTAGVALRARRRQAAQEKADNDDDGGAAEISTSQSVVADLGIRDIVAERIDNALFGGGGGGGDEPNIEVSQDGDSLLVITKDIEFAGDSEGFDVETGGISYSSGAGGGLTDDFTS